MPDSYSTLVIYATKGASGLDTSNVLGSTLYNSASTNSLVPVTFGVVLFFWPAMLVAGAINIAFRSIRVFPFVWGLVAFLAAYVMMDKAPGSLGIGAYVDMASAVLFLVAWIATVARKVTAPPPPTSVPPSTP